MTLVQVCHHDPLPFWHTPIRAHKLAVLSERVNLVQGELILGGKLVSPAYNKRALTWSRTYRIQVPWAEWTTVFEDLVEALLDSGKFVGLKVNKRDTGLGGEIWDLDRQTGKTYDRHKLFANGLAA